MPRSTREYLLRYADEATHDLDRALTNLLALKIAYGDIHPDYAQAVELIMILVRQAQEFLTEFKAKRM
jgi:hypothetical protein